MRWGRRLFQSTALNSNNDFSDYSINEPRMDGTANLAYLLSALASSTNAR
jgi:hypothetical protein